MAYKKRGRRLSSSVVRSNNIHKNSAMNARSAFERCYHEFCIRMQKKYNKVLTETERDYFRFIIAGRYDSI